MSYIKKKMCHWFMIWRREFEKAKGISFAGVNRVMKDMILVLAPIVLSYLNQ